MTLHTYVYIVKLQQHGNYCVRQAPIDLKKALSAHDWQLIMESPSFLLFRLREGSALSLFLCALLLWLHCQWMNGL